MKEHLALSFLSLIPTELYSKLKINLTKINKLNNNCISVLTRSVSVGTVHTVYPR